MITDHLDKCPWCPAKMFNGGGAFRAIFCSREKDHPNNMLWAYFDDHDRPDTITAINLMCGNYQFFWCIPSQNTTLLWVKSGITILKFDYLLDFSLDPETINRKIQTLITFS